MTFTYMLSCKKRRKCIELMNYNSICCIDMLQYQSHLIRYITDNQHGGEPFEFVYRAIEHNSNALKNCSDDVILFYHNNYYTVLVLSNSL